MSSNDNLIFYSGKIIADITRDIIYFPLWWYSRGLVQLIRILKDFLASRQKSLALLIWVKNIHRPMYGQFDWQGMLISFFVRLVQIIIRSIIMLFWLIFTLAIFIFWIFLPIFVIYQIIYQLI
ncbi:MAG: hypothetical protein ABIG60_04635 [Patescibacteria group bacterium]